MMAMITVDGDVELMRNTGILSFRSRCALVLVVECSPDAGVLHCWTSG